MKVKKIVKNFQISYLALFPEQFNKIIAAQYIANSYIQFFLPHKFREFLIDFVIQYNHHFEIFEPDRKYEDMEVRIMMFIEQIINHADADILNSYPDTYQMLKKILDYQDRDFCREILDNYSSVETFFISFTEIISQQEKYGIKSLNTLKKYITLLNIEVHEERNGKPGKYITEFSLKRILEEMAK